MKRIINLSLNIFPFICFIALANFAYSQTNSAAFDKKIPVEELISDFKIVRENLENLHIGLYTYTPKDELDKEFERITSELDKPLTTMEFFRKLTRLNKFIGNNHTGFSPPSNILNAIRKETPSFPFEPYWDGKHLYILKNLSLDKTIRDGSKIKSINGTSAEELINEMANMLQRDGYNKTYPIYRINGGFSIHYAILKEITDTFDVEFEDPSGEVRKKRIQGLSAGKIAENRTARYKNQKASWRRTKEPALTLAIKEDVAAMTIKTFEVDLIKERKQKWKKFFKTSFKKIVKAKVKHLIIDLRDNRGGQPAPTIRLLKHLYDKPFTLYKSIQANVSRLPRRPYFVDDGTTETFEKEIRWIKKGNVFEMKDKDILKLHKPSKNQFRGKLYVLTNAFSTSATGTLTGQLKSRTNAIFIGEEAGGNPNQTVARQGVDIILPNSKVKVLVPLVLSVKDVNFENKGRGVIPDYDVKPSIEDLLNNKDPVMEFALKLIKSE